MGITAGSYQKEDRVYNGFPVYKNLDNDKAILYFSAVTKVVGCECFHGIYSFRERKIGTFRINLKGIRQIIPRTTLLNVPMMFKNGT